MRHLFLILVPVLLFAGCITDSGDNTDPLIGYWLSNSGGYSITFRPDGSYSSPEWGRGSYTASGSSLTLKTANHATTVAYYQRGDFLSLARRDGENTIYFDYIRQRQ